MTRVTSTTTETLAETNGIELCYQQFGPDDGTPLVLIMGLGAQMVFWPMPLIDDLVARGYRVIRFDNRDIGHSTRFRWQQSGGATGALLKHLLKRPVATEYTLYDMVADTIGLLDYLNIDKAHLVGASMGGLIAQLTAATHPNRVASLTSIMSNTNSPWLTPPKPSALWALIGPKELPQTLDQYLKMGRATTRKIGGKLPQGDLLDEVLTETYHRGLYPRGIKQQFMAILGTGDISHQLKHIVCPTTVIHGAIDPLLRPAGGKASARAIHGASLKLIKGMGHDLPPAVLPQIANLIDATAKKAAGAD